MISIFIMIVIAIALSAAAGFGILTLIKSSETALLVQRNQVRIDAVVNAIRSHVRFKNGEALVPLQIGGNPSDTGIYSAVVPSISPFSSTTWGAPLVYCPAVPGDGSLGSASISNGSESYQVQITLESGNAYVSAGGPSGTGKSDEIENPYPSLREAMRARNAVALLISPNPNVELPPRCDAVVYSPDSASFLVDGGSVTAVVASPVPLNVSNGPLVLAIDENVPADLPDAANVVRSLSEAASFIRKYHLNDATIQVGDDASVIPAAHLMDLMKSTEGRRIRLVGGSNSVVSVIGSGSEIALTVPGTLAISKVSFSNPSGDVGFSVASSGKLSVRDGSFGFLRIVGGDAVLRGAVTISPTSSLNALAQPITLTGGRLVVDEVPHLVASSAASVGVIARGGDISIIGNTRMTLAPAGKAFKVDMGGRVLPGTLPDSQIVSVTVNGISLPLNSLIGEMSGTETIARVSDKGIQRSLVTAEFTCADGDTSCEVTCPSASVIAWGECSSLNASPLAGFGSDPTGRKWTCHWSTPSSPSKPIAKAVCSNLP